MANLNFFLPKQPIFFDLFRKLNKSLDKMTNLFSELVNNFNNFENYSLRAKEIEHEADTITHDIIQRLHKTFITPIDREDIYHLAHEIDDIVDIIENVINNIYLFEIKNNQNVFKDFAKIIIAASQNLTRLIDHLQLQKISDSFNEEIIKIHGLEDQGDLLFQKAMHELFLEQKDPVTIIKLKDIIERLEKTMDRFQGVADIIRGIIVKSS